MKSNGGDTKEIQKKHVIYFTYISDNFISLYKLASTSGLRNSSSEQSQGGAVPVNPIKIQSQN